MPLVRLYLVPGYEGLSSRWGHYILITGIHPDGFYFSDPLKTDPVAVAQGPGSRANQGVSALQPVADPGVRRLADQAGLLEIPKQVSTENPLW